MNHAAVRFGNAFHKLSAEGIPTKPNGGIGIPDDQSGEGCSWNRGVDIMISFPRHWMTMHSCADWGTS